MQLYAGIPLVSFRTKSLASSFSLVMRRKSSTKRIKSWRGREGKRERGREGERGGGREGGREGEREREGEGGGERY